ncbi:MAG: hypothetical protein ABIB71_03210 [Candidatus Woesearchaeota archaeon]
MRILVGTDMHEDWDSLKAYTSFGRHREHDCFILLGDLGNGALEGKDLENFHKKKRAVANYLYRDVQRRDWLYGLGLSYYQMERSLPIVARDLSKRRATPKLLKAELEQYLLAIDLAYNNMLDKYVKVRYHIEGLDAITIPGNHDTDFSTTMLEDIDLHLKSKEINGLKIAGYGGAAAVDYSSQEFAIPMTIYNFPLEISAGFEERVERDSNDNIGRIVSEAGEHFRKEKPDIALLHNPVYGIGDRVLQRDNEGKPMQDKEGNLLTEHSGSRGLLDYALDGISKLIISGHIHESPEVRAIEARNGNIVTVINPGPLGETERRKYIKVQGTQTLTQDKILTPTLDDNIWGGRFMELNLDEERNFKSGRLYQIMDTKDPKDVYIIASYYLDGKNIKEMKLAQRFY